MPRIDLSLSPSQDVEPFSHPTTSAFFTAAKMKRALYYFLSAITGVGAALVLGFALTKTFLPLTAAFGALPLFLLAFYFGWNGARIYDYSDPKELSLIQEEALHKPLLDLAARHSWKNIFLYQIISPQDFLLAFQHNADSLDITGIVLMRKKAEEGLESANLVLSVGQIPKYSFPDLTPYREKYHQETGSLPCVEILRRYPIDDLAKYHIISEREAELLFRLRKKYEQAKLECRAQIDYTEREFRNHTAGRPFAAGKFIGHEYVAAASRRRAKDPNRFRDFSRHLGVETLGDSAFNALTAQERDHRLAATAFHGDQFKEELERINDEYDANRKSFA